MTQLELAYAERVADAGGTTSASYGNVTSPQLTSGQFVTGKKYLILARAEITMNTLAARGGIRLVHGSTVFDGSTQEFTPITNIGEWSPYFYFTVWTAVAGEGVNLQTKGNGTARCDQRFSSLAAIRLSDAVVEATDWLYGEHTTSTVLTTSQQTGATLTWTPPVGGDTWLLMTRGRMDFDFTVDEFCSRMDRTGEAATSWEMIHGGRAAGDSRVLAMLWAGPLAAVAQTFREQSRRIGTGANTAARTGSAVFALNLARLDAANYTLADAHLDVISTTQYGTQVASVGHAQVVAGGKALVLGQLCFDPTSDTGDRYFYARVQQDNVDSFSADGIANTYSGANGGRSYYPNSQVDSPGQVWPYIHASIETLGAGTYDFDLDASIINAGSGRGVKFRRIMALSLELASGAPPPSGGAGSAAPERNEQIMYQHDYSAPRRRVRVRITDSAGAAITNAASTQGAISKNGAAFTTTGVGVLVAEESANGLYYSELTAAALDALGSYRYRVAPAGAALFSVVFPVEELPWVYDGLASAGGANYVDLSGPPAYIQPGSLVRIVDGPGAGQSMLALSYASPRVTMEANWDTNPTSASRILVQPGLPFRVPDVNVSQIAGKAAAATNLAEGAEALGVATVRTGANSPVQIVCDLPVVVGGVATPANFWKDRGLVIKTGALAGDHAIISGSSVSGADTVLALDPNSALTGTPAVGVKFVVT